MGWIHGKQDIDYAPVTEEQATFYEAYLAKKAAGEAVEYQNRLIAAAAEGAAYATKRAEVVAAPLTVAHAEMVAEGLAMGLDQITAETWAKCQVAGIY